MITAFGWGRLDEYFGSGLGGGGVQVQAQQQEDKVFGDSGSSFLKVKKKVEFGGGRGLVCGVFWLRGWGGGGGGGGSGTGPTAIR